MQTLVLIPDIQVPQHDRKAINVVLNLIKYIKPNRACFLGDVICCDSVSKYPKSSWGEAALTLKHEVATTNIILDTFDTEFKRAKTKDIWFIEGNHEERLMIWAIKYAKNLGEDDDLTIEHKLRLDKRGYKYIPVNKQPLKFNNFNIIHGYYTNQYHASKTIRKTHRNTFYGHTHDCQVHTSDHDPNDSPKIAMSCGSLCDFNQSYIRGRPTNWIHGMGLVYYDEKGFTAYFIPIIKYRAIWDGKVFTA